MTTESSDSRSGEITFLGLVAAVVEAWKWFVIVPVSAAVIVFLLMGQLGSTHRSSAILRIGDSSALLTSPSVLRPTIEKVDIGETLGGTMTQATNALARRISTRVLAANLTEVTLTWPTAEGAQTTLQALIDQLSLQIMPRGEDREQIERQIAAARATLEKLRSYEDELTSGPASGGVSAATNDSTLGYLALVNDIQTTEAEIASLEQSLQGIRAEDIVQAPTLSDEAVGDNRLIFTVLAAIAAALCVLFVVLVREAIRAAPGDPQAAADLNRIRKSLRIRRKSGT